MATAVEPEVVVDDPTPSDAPAPSEPATLTTGAAQDTPPSDTTTEKTDDTAETPAEVVYDLKLPDDSVLDAAAVERMTTHARESGLSPEVAQKQLDFVNSETKALQASFLESNSPGGAEWTKNVQAWEGEARKDPELGGTPEKFNQTVNAARKVLADYGDPKLDAWLTETGFGSHPMVLKLFAKIAKATAEGSPIPGGNRVPQKKDLTDAEVFYDHPSNKPTKTESDT